MPRFPKDRKDTFSLCYQVLAEDLEAMVQFTELTGLAEEDPDIVEKLSSLAAHARASSKKLALKIVEKGANIISVDFEKKDEE